MKHILIYIITALCIFGLMGLYFAQDNNISAAPVATVESNSPKQTTTQIGILYNGIENSDKVEFRSALSKQLDKSANISASDCDGDSALQMTYYRKMLTNGCRYLFVEIFDAANVDEMISLAAKQGATLFFMDYTPTTAQCEAYSGVYSIGYAEYDEVDMAANLLASYWQSNSDEMDFKSDGTLSYAVVSDSGFADTEDHTRLEELAAEKGCTMSLVKDTVTEYLNYNFEQALDTMFFANTEAILFMDSADAEKAYHYYHDPSEYSHTPQIKLCVMSADETAYMLHGYGQILFATGNGGTVLGRMAAGMISTLESGEALSYTTVGIMPTNGGRTYLCNGVTLRNIIISENPDDEE